MTVGNVIVRRVEHNCTTTRYVYRKLISVVIRWLTCRPWASSEF